MFKLRLEISSVCRTFTLGRHKVATGMSCPSLALDQKSFHNLVGKSNPRRDVQVRVFSYRSGLHRLMSSEINTGQVFHRLKRSKIFNRSGLYRLMRSNIFNRSGLYRLMRSEVFNRPSSSKVRDGAGQRFLRVQLCEVREVNRTECRS